MAEEIICRAFPTTLKGPIRIWFNKLTTNSINTFKELSAQFASHFIRGYRYKKSTTCLMNINQWEDKHSKPLTGRFTSFTPLHTLIDQVLMQIKDEEALTFPGKLKGDPSKRSKDKYCHFHRDHSHDTSDCYDLKQQIEAFIRQRKLQRFVGKEKTD